MDAKLAIGELAKRTDTKVVTIRYYETVGLLPSPPRTKANYRVYSQAHADRLAFIRRSRALGFTLDQIRELLSLTERKTQDCRAIDDIARVHLKEVEAKVADLSRLAKELSRIVRRCRGGTIGECRIIEALQTAS
jgi:DNA-binding transcriptional MerR regulator